MKRIGAVVLCCLLAVILTLNTSAEDSAPSETFTHWELPNGQIEAVAMRTVYEAVESITARRLGLRDDIGTIIDIDCDPNSNTYILTDTGRIISFNTEYHLVRDYTIVSKDGEDVDISGAKGISVYSGTEFYIADTKNCRVLRCVDGVVKQEIVLPKSPLIPTGFVFQPVKVARDSKGYLYVLSDGSYYGAVLYDPKGDFAGFYGANTVKGTVLTTLSYLWDRMTQNDVKRAKVVKTLPYQFSDIYIDANDFVYTSTGMNAGGDIGQIRMLNPGGKNIMAGADSFNFGESDLVKRRKTTVRQNFGAIQTDKQGFIYALDKTYGLIYIYDTDSNLIAAFGGGSGLGVQTGIFSAACSIAVSGSSLMVADSLRNSITVFKRTDYCEALLAAQELTLNSDYSNAKPLWEKVQKYDSLNRFALRGLAKAAYTEGDYSAAMDYAKAGYDTVTYSQAKEKVQNAFISNHFVWLFLLAVLMVAGLTALVLYTSKRQIVLIRNAKLRTMVSGMYHPFQSFNDIKYKKMGSLRIALIMTALFYLSSVAAVTGSDFRYTSFDPSTYNSLFQIIQTVGLILLWSVANWGVSTLLEGKGRLIEVHTVTAYSTLPLILYNLVSAPLSHLISSSNSTLISGLHTLALVFAGIMLCIGLMVVHDFSFPRFLFSAAVTVMLAILVIFILFMVGILLMQFWSFLATVFLEATA